MRLDPDGSKHNPLLPPYRNPIAKQKKPPPLRRRLSCLGELGRDHNPFVLNEPLDRDFGARLTGPAGVVIMLLIPKFPLCGILNAPKFTAEGMGAN